MISYWTEKFNINCLFCIIDRECGLSLLLIFYQGFLWGICQFSDMCCMHLKRCVWFFGDSECGTVSKLCFVLSGLVAYIREISGSVLDRRGPRASPRGVCVCGFLYLLKFLLHHNGYRVTRWVGFHACHLFLVNFSREHHWRHWSALCFGQEYCRLIKSQPLPSVYFHLLGKSLLILLIFLQLCRPVWRSFPFNGWFRLI